MNNKLKYTGHFKIDHYRDGKLLDTYHIDNAIVTEGVHYNLEGMFRGGSQSATWYLGLINNSGWTAFNAAHTMASHAGWSETTAYSEATRPQWTADAAAARGMSNSSTVDFSITGAVTIKGMFVCNENTKGGSTGEMWSEGAFSSLASVQNGDVLKTTYTVTVS